MFRLVEKNRILSKAIAAGHHRRSFRAPFSLRDHNVILCSRTLLTEYQLAPVVRMHADGCFTHSLTSSQ